jgi:mannose-1-phosphate guanylyltransferase
MLVCPSDHKIHPASRFEEAVLAAAAIAAEGGDLVTFGIRARAPSTAFGYIQRGEPRPSPSLAAFRAARFVEKPDRSRAEELLRGGDHYWNAGIFVWRISAVRQAIARHFPELAAGLEPMGRLFREGAPAEEVMAERFPSLATNSIDRAVLEKSAACGEVVVVEAPFEWDDVGSWNALERYLPRDPAGNHVEGRHLGIDTQGCIISGSGRRLIATIGLEDLVVVETEDAVLICHRDQVEKVKDLVRHLELRGEGDRA